MDFKKMLIKFRKKNGHSGIIAVCMYRFVMIQLGYYGTYGYCFYGTSVKNVPEYDIMLLRCYVTYHSCISYVII